MRKNHQQGFTFIELMYVVTIIGILAAIALPAYQDYMTRAKLVEALLMPSEVKRSVNDYYKLTGRLPANNLQAGVAPATAYRGNYVTAIEVDNGVIHIKLDTESIGLYGENAINWFSIRPQISENIADLDIIWNCNVKAEIPGLKVIGSLRTDIPAKYLPANCR